MKIKPLSDHILIEPIKGEEKTKSGILLPETSEKEKPEQGKVVSVGPGKKDESGKLIKAIEVNYKQNVMANMRWTHEWINSDGKHHEYLFLMEKSQQKIWFPRVSSKSVPASASSRSLVF